MTLHRWVIPVNDPPVTPLLALMSYSQMFQCPVQAGLFAGGQFIEKTTSCRRKKPRVGDIALLAVMPDVMLCLWARWETTSRGSTQIAARRE